MCQMIGVVITIRDQIATRGITRQTANVTVSPANIAIDSFHLVQNVHVMKEI